MVPLASLGSHRTPFRSQHNTADPGHQPELSGKEPGGSPVKQSYHIPRLL